MISDYFSGAKNVKHETFLERAGSRAEQGERGGLITLIGGGNGRKEERQSGKKESNLIYELRPRSSEYPIADINHET